MSRFSFACFFVIFTLAAWPAKAESFLDRWVDQSHDAFFSPEVAALADSYQRFAVFWWDFIAYEGADKSDSAVAQSRAALCKAIQNSQAVVTSGCISGLGSLRPLLTDWDADLPRRADAPKVEEWRKYIEASRAQATLPGSEAVLWLLRLDPTGSYLDLKKRFDKNVSDFAKNLGGQNIIPVQFAFAPSETTQTAQFESALAAGCPECKNITVLGPHGSVLENQSRIRNDLDVVNTVGAVMGILLIGFLVYVRRLKLLNIILPLGAAIGLGAVVVILVYGHIHALTLAFGTGLVGLAVDYGLHSAFWSKSWRPNIYGLLTTLAVFVAGGITHIPLLRQMMFFGAVGISIAFLILFLLFKFREQLFVVEPFSFKPTVSRGRLAVVVLSSLGLVYGAIFMRPNFDLRLFDFQSAETKKLQNVLKEAFASRNPMLEIFSSDADFLAQEAERKTFAESHAIDFESVARYMPEPKVQGEHLATWSAEFCPERKWRLNTDEEDFATPALSRDCAHLNPWIPGQGEASVPTYLNHLYSKGTWAHIWLPNNLEQAKTVRAAYPKAVSIDSMAEFFARALDHDILLIMPIAVIGIFLLLAIEFRRWRLVLLASLPFFSGAGLMIWFFALMHWPLSFMSLIGLVMICGFSVDYGIFVTDALTRGRLPSAQGLWSALSLCAVCAVGGFLPMVFGHHPVLRHLGFSLTVGSIGTWIGTYWGILSVAKYVFHIDIDRAVTTPEGHSIKVTEGHND